MRSLTNDTCKDPVSSSSEVLNRQEFGGEAKFNPLQKSWRWICCWEPEAGICVGSSQDLTAAQPPVQGWAPWGADSERDTWGQQVRQLGISPEEGVGAGSGGALRSPEEDSPGLRAVGAGRSRQGLSGHWMPAAVGRMYPWLRPSLPLSEGPPTGR